MGIFEEILYLGVGIFEEILYLGVGIFEEILYLRVSIRMFAICTTLRKSNSM